MLSPVVRLDLSDNARDFRRVAAERGLPHAGQVQRQLQSARQGLIRLSEGKVDFGAPPNAELK
jgi:hypothetical protein